MFLAFIVCKGGSTWFKGGSTWFIGGSTWFIGDSIGFKGGSTKFKDGSSFSQKTKRKILQYNDFRQWGQKVNVKDCFMMLFKKDLYNVRFLKHLN